MGVSLAVDHLEVAAARHGLLDLVLLRLAEVVARTAAAQPDGVRLRLGLGDAPPDLGGRDLEI